MNQVYQRGDYKVYSIDEEFIVHNTKKDFQEGHTHIRNFNACKKIIACCIEHKLPHDLPRYLLISIARVATGEFQQKALELIENKKRKPTYVNTKKKG